LASPKAAPRPRSAPWKLAAKSNTHAARSVSLTRGGDALEGEETSQLLEEGAIQIEFAYRNSNEAVIEGKRDTSSTACEWEMNSFVFNET
jgi:hypothetical protein